MSRKGRKTGRRILALLLAATGLALVCALAFGIYAVASWGTFDREKLENYAQTTFLYDHEGNRIDSMHGSENRVNISVSTLPEHVKNAFIAAEDLRFYKHFGVDLIRIGGAFINDIKTGSYSQGASTITQQLIKLTHLTPQKTLTRKLNEAYYAILVERAYTKDQILEMYVNYVYLGNGAYGIQAAAQKYFGIDANELSLAQAASLAAILKAPSTYSPHINAQANQTRRDLILSIMLEEGMISQTQAAQARGTPVQLNAKASESQRYGWFVDEAVDQAVELLEIDLQELLSGGYHIYTTLDTAASNACETAAVYASNISPAAPSGEQPQCAVVLMDKDGAVRAMVGGAAYTTAKGLNRAMTRRQPGSAIKPIGVYSPAIELLGTQTVTYMLDQQQDFNGYVPSNYGGYYYGYVSVRTAFEKSLNIPAVSLVNQMGVQASVSYINKFGIATEAGDNYLPVALGSMTYGVSPYDLCAAYLAFINNGIKPDAYLITKITNSAGQMLYEYAENRTAAISSSTAYLICDMMRSTVQNGTGRRLAALGYPIGAKTGTVDYEGIGNRDAWSVAVTPGHAIAVWMGYDSTTPESRLDSSVTGSNQPTQAILNILTEYLPQGEGDFVMPDGVVRLNLDGKSLWEAGQAYLATEITPPAYTVSEVFQASSRPYEDSPYWQIPSPPSDLTVAGNSLGNPVLTFTITGNDARYHVYRSAGGSTELIASVEGKSMGETVSISDDNAHWLTRNDYYITAEHRVAADYGMTNAVSAPSEAVSYRPFFFPFGWDLDF